MPEVYGVGKEFVVLVGVPDESDEGGRVTEVLAFGTLGCVMMAGATVG